MLKQHFYNTSLTERHDFNSIIKQNQKYDSVLISVVNYDSVTDGFTQTTTKYVKSVLPSTSFAMPDITIVSSATFSASPLDFLVNSGLASSSNMNSGSVVSVLVVYSAPRLNIVITNTLFSQSFVSGGGLMRSNLRVGYTNFNSSSLVFSSSPIVRQYYLLSDWDGYNLSDLDSRTLQEMDYQSV